MPSLYTENGPRAGHQYRLDSPKVVVGRHPDCDVVVDVGAVSRQHAQFVEAGGQYYLEDLDSRNGTYVNNTLVEGRHPLSHGDRIQVCDVSFRFDNAAQRAFAIPNQDEPSSVLLEDRPHDNAVVMSKVDVVTATGSVAVTASADVKLKALIDITTSLSRTLALDNVLPQLLESLFNLFVQADRGFIILQNDEGDLIPRWTKLRRGDDDRMIRLSRTIINQVVESKQAILSADTMDDSRFQLSESIADFRIRSFICAPLIDVELNVLGAIQLDSLDHRNRFRPEDLELLASVAGQAAIAVDNAHLHEQVVRQHVLERDLELAEQVQRGFLPQRSPQQAGYELLHFYQPAGRVGGDYFDYISLPDGRVAVVLADVVGHGMAAALQTAQLSAALRFSLATQADPAQAICQLNQTLSEGSLEDRFITFVMVVLHPDSNKVTIVNAGHMPPLLCRGDDEPVEVGEEICGLPLLILDSFAYESADISLQANDHLLMYTDGLNESMNAKDELYGLDRLRRQVKGCREGQELIERLITDIQAFSGGVDQKDDMCLVCCTRKSD